jgi:rhodanese-related sulfurtransferase
MSDVTLNDFAAAHATGAAQVVDVREPAEYLAGHVPGAASIPMGQLPDRLNEINRSKPVFVICQAGGRSSAMTDVLLHHGFDARSVTGGTAAWTDSSHPVDIGAPERK